MMILTHAPTGSAYTVEEDALLQTPLYKDGTFDTDTNEWCEVEYRDEVADGIYSILLRARELDPEYVPVD